MLLKYSVKAPQLQTQRIFLPDLLFLLLLKGNPADSRMRAASKRRGIEITSISRPIRPSDFKDFDLILAMDNQNRRITVLRFYSCIMFLSCLFFLNIFGLFDLDGSLFIYVV